MSEQNPTKAQLQDQLEKAQRRNEELEEQNAALENTQADMDKRLSRMETLIQEQRDAGEYQGPQPKIYHDPFDSENPHKILAHPDGKVLSWKNPRVRADRGMRGWVFLTWDSEVGRNIDKYIASPPAKMAGIEHQDNYIRRGTDSILSMIDEEIWLARQNKREEKALRKQRAANARANRALAEGVETFGDGVTDERRPVGGFKPRQELPVPEGGHRTRLLHPDEE